ncbi:NUC189-domain-containing protein [Calocera viscosa TUFC12733]|uniref:NUC189-domain-containing protein n=1 Tax=Calocera viscosa (strain TUFC12733) TaxID=1330018 RepID=A0A167RAT8_CALVF|nr:NUC189-domain-containing protein [Calocera viscosa TUFC12733]
MSAPAKRRKTSRPSAAHHLSTLTPSHPQSQNPASLLPATTSGPLLSKGKAYSERTTAISSGFSAPTTDDLPDLAQDVDLAQPSLGDLALASHPPPALPTSAQEGAAPNASSKLLPIPSTSLSRILAQSLHSQDLILLESCLQHRSPALVRASVQRLPQSLALPLLDACVERLSKGGRTGGKGGGAAANTERAETLVEWVRAVLLCHTAYLLTVPDVVTRLAGLYSILNARLALHPRLLTLSGRLDLVLGQLEMRDSIPLAPHALPTKGEKGKGKKGKGRKYVEGESEEEDGAGVEVERGEGEEGSVEDVELGASEEEEEDEDEDEEEGEDVLMDDVDEELEGDEDEDEEEEDEDEEDEGEVKANGFLHAEDSEEEEEEEESE